MQPTTDSVVDGVTKILAEEAHLLGQELQDSLTRTESKRLMHLTATLDRLDETLVQRRSLRAHGYSPAKS